jgi:hypothetical protein
MGWTGLYISEGMLDISWIRVFGMSCLWRQRPTMETIKQPVCLIAVYGYNGQPTQIATAVTNNSDSVSATETWNT